MSVETNWRFGLQRADDRHRDPTQGEYFQTDAESLMREAIQNSLDASASDGPVVVRVHVNESGIAVDEELRELFDGLTPHLDAAAAQAHVVPFLPDRCRYLVVEDFGTRGLNGDPDECFDGKVGGDFYHFFRADGRSGKPQGRRGSWGYGKYTFVKASRINTFFGLTVPSDGNRSSALGQAVLTNHQAGNQHFRPDGWWGRAAGDSDDRYTTSVGRDSAQYQLLCDVFGLTREAPATGLSVVVPFLVEEITTSSILAAILDNYLPSLVMGELVVEVSSDIEDPVILDETTVSEVLRGREFDATPLAILQMSLGLQKEPDIYLAHTATSPSWNDYELNQQDIDRIEELLSAEEVFTVRLPVVVEPKEGATRESFLDICYMPSGGERSKPSFFRSGIRVTDAQRKSTVRARSMVWITEDALVTMLGLAETPAHNNWKSTNDRFKGQYKNGPRWVGFFKRAPIELLDRASAGKPTEDRKTLSNFFPVATETRRYRSGPDSPSSVGTSVGPTLGLDERSVPVRISPYRSNGFRVKLSGEVEVGDELDIVVAYDVLIGNPFNKWSSLDFDLSEMSVGSSGVKVLERVGQRIRIRALEREAEIEVWGFNRWLDVIVRCEAPS